MFFFLSFSSRVNYRRWQVDAFLEAHDSGLTDEDKEVANGT